MIFNNFSNKKFLTYKNTQSLKRDKIICISNYNNTINFKIQFKFN